MLARGDDPVGGGREPCDGEDLPGQVAAFASSQRPRLRRGQAAGGEPQGGCNEGKVHPEHEPPAGESHEQSPGHRTDGRGDTTGSSPQADGSGPVGGAIMDEGEHCQGGRDDRGGTDTLQRAEGDERATGRGQGTGRREQAEDRQAEQVDASCAQSVTGRPCRQLQGCEGEGVGVDDPLQGGDRDAQVPADPRQRHVDDRRVEHDDEEPEQRRDEGAAPSVSAHEWSPCPSGPVLAPSAGCCRPSAG